MLITCGNCKTSYDVADQAVMADIFQVKCSRCGHVFTAFRGEQPGPSVVLQKKDVLPDKYKVIAVCGQKGGVAKTSTVLNLGMSLAMLGRRVLLVDFDIQASLTLAFGYVKQQKSFYDLVDDSAVQLTNIIRKTPRKNLWLLPSQANLSLLAKKYITRKKCEYLLRDTLLPVKEQVEHIIIDTPPAMEFLTVNALLASDLVIVPTQCEYFSMHGVSHVEDAIKLLARAKEKTIDYGILITMYHSANTAEGIIRDKIAKKYPGRVFKQKIEFDPKLQESQILHMPVILHDRESPSARQYLNLAREIMGKR